MSGRDVEILGEIPTDAADLTPRLKALVAGAGDRPLAAALVLPESQILYTRLPAPGPDDAAREEQVRAGLDGRTPYALDEIAFDWEAEGDEALVAAIALETLDEAARFAAAHGIEVRGYLAQPEPELFPRDVIFPGAVAEAETAAETAEEETAEPIPAEPVAAEPAPAQPVAVFTAMRALPDAQSLAARLAATSTRFRPSEPAGTGAAGIAAPGIQGTVEPAPAVTAGPDRTAAPVTADWVPDAGPVAKSAPAISAPSRPAAVPAAAPAPAAAAPRAPAASLAQALPQIPRRRVAIAALVAFLLIAGGWTLLATFGPRDPSESTLILPEGTEVPDTALAGSESLGDLDPEAFVPTVEELDEGIDADVAGDPAAAPPSAAERQVFVDVPPIAGRLFALKDDTWRTAPAAPAMPAVGSDFEIELAAIDPVTRSTDAFAMPPAGLPDRLPGDAADADAIGDTPPGGVALDLAGDEVPSGDGALRPTALAAALTDDIRPRVRPEGIVEDAERARFNGMTLSDLAGIRPTERPASPQSDPSVNPEATALAVQRSPLPRDRPDNIDELIAIALAVQEPEAAPEQQEELSAEPPQGVAAASTATEGVATARAPEPEPAPAPAPAPEAPAASTDEEPEPEVVAAAPSMPTRAEVAREATIENAIRLRDLNLIGVYGAPSDRRALVRLPSGRFVKVEVGDRVDGGQVAAIGENSLRYVKSGREHTLVVPSG
jgi:hypothetical protein